jgi:DNA-binding response OmpR family regulator
MRDKGRPDKKGKPPVDFQRQIMAEAIGTKARAILVVNKRLPPLKEIVTTLRAANFVVLQADSKAKAINLAARHAETIDLLLADSDLLGGSGLSLPEALRQTRPALQVMLFCGKIVIGSFGCTLIQKPFDSAKLMEIINSVLQRVEEAQRTWGAGSAWQAVG